MTQPRNIWELGEFCTYVRRTDGVEYLDTSFPPCKDLDNARAAAIIIRDQLALKYGEDEHDVYIKAYVRLKEKR